MESIYSSAINEIKKDENVIRQDGLYSFLSLMTQKLFKIQTKPLDEFIEQIENRFNLVNEFATNKIEESILKSPKKLNELRPKQLAFINGQFKEIYKPLEKFTVFENGKPVTKYKTEGIAIEIFKNKNETFKTEIKNKAIESANLIKRITTEQAIKVSDSIQKSYAIGDTQEQIQNKIKKIINVGEGRASNIARDQIQKLTVSINDNRAKSIGSEKYIYRTIGDSRVRDTHAESDGKEYYYDGRDEASKEANEKFNEPNCRCSKEPIF